MADIPPINPAPGAPVGAEPPMKKTTGKVQPKKETVRINLPPKPTAAPTIKLPTLPPGGPTGASSGAPLMSTPGATPMQTQASARAAAPVAPPPQRGAAPVAAPRAAPVAAAAPVAVTVSGLDKILALAACVLALAAVGTTVWMMVILNGAMNQ